MFSLRKLTALTAALLLAASPVTTARALSTPFAVPDVVDINGGVLGLYVVNTLTSMGNSAGVITSFHGTTAAPAGSAIGSYGFRIFAGEVDINHGIGDAMAVGNIQMSSPTITVMLRHLQFDNSGPTPNVSAEILVNGAIVGRSPVFTLNVSGMYPFTSTPTTFHMNQVPMNVADSFVFYINGVFGKQVFTVGSPAGLVGMSTTLGTIP